MIGGFNVAEPDAAEKTMRHQPALYFVPDLAKTGIEFLSAVLFFHASLPDFSAPPARRLSAAPLIEYRLLYVSKAVLAEPHLIVDEECRRTEYPALHRPFGIRDQLRFHSRGAGN